MKPANKVKARCTNVGYHNLISPLPIQIPRDTHLRNDLEQFLPMHARSESVLIQFVPRRQPQLRGGVGDVRCLCDAACAQVDA